jgi:hypothetical protein
MNTPNSTKHRSSLSLEELFNVSKIIGKSFEPQNKDFGEYSDDDITDQMELGDLLSQFSKNEFNAI